MSRALPSGPGGQEEGLCGSADEPSLSGRGIGWRIAAAGAGIKKFYAYRSRNGPPPVSPADRRSLG